MNVRLIATDLDGTMLSSKKTVSERTRDTFRRAREQGCVYTLATGRCSTIIPHEQLPECDYMILDNGAEIRNRKTGEVIYAAYMAESDLLALLDKLCDYPIAMECFVDGTLLIDEALYKNLIKEQFHMGLFAKGLVTIVPDLRAYLEKGNARVTKINLLFRDLACFEEVGEKLYASSGFEVANGANTWYELTREGVSKGVALGILCDRLGIDIKDAAAFGDSMNDVSMLKVAGWSVAMGNSTKEAEEAAKYHTLTNDEDGVADFIEKNFELA